MAAALDSSSTEGRPAKRRRPGLAALLSLLAPGVGSLYNGEVRRGAVLLAVFLAIELAGWGPYLVPPTPALVEAGLLLAVGEILLRIGAAVDAFRHARRAGAIVPRRFQHGWVYIALLLVAPLMGLARPAPGFRSFNVPSSSMLPTLLVGDRVVADTGWYRTHPPQRGDLAFFWLPHGGGTYYIKRIVGLPGDRVQLKNGILYIDDTPAALQRLADYRDGEAGAVASIRRYRETLADGRFYSILRTEAAGPQEDTPEYRVPPGTYFMLGDNRDNSLDSRAQDTVGFVPRRNLVGRPAVLLFSTDGSAPAWQIWQWPAALRRDRLLREVE